MCVIITYIGDWMMPVHLYAHFHLNEIDRVLCNGMDKKEKQQTKKQNPFISMEISLMSNCVWEREREKKTE